MKIRDVSGNWKRRHAKFGPGPDEWGKREKKSHVFSSLFPSMISGANSIISCFYLGADLHRNVLILFFLK